MEETNKIDPDELSLAEPTDFVEEDTRSKVIKDLTDDEEIDAAIDILEKKYDVPAKDTTSGKPEPKPDETGKDTSDKPEDKTKAEQKPKEVDQKPVVDEKEKPKEEPGKVEEPVKKVEFVLTEELIQKQPEEFREILNKYKDKGKAELAKAAASAVALKNNYLKDDEKVIGALTEKFQNLTDEELVNTLIETQAKVGAPEPGVKPKVEQPLKEEKIELPSLPEDEKVKSVLDKETAKRLKKLYPEMPDDMTSEEYQEWERDLQDKGGLRKVEKYLNDLRSTEANVKTELQKVIYAQTNLTNLYDESPAEILPLLTTENLPKLKKLNDDYRSVNNKSLEEEVGLIKKELAKYNITEAELGIDLTLTKDENGSYYNEKLNNLMLNGNEADPNIVGQMGKVPFLRQGQLAKKFVYENVLTITNHLVKNVATKAKVETEKLKDETLNTLGESKSKGLKTITNPEDVKKITDDATLDKLIGEIESKYQ